MNFPNVVLLEIRNFCNTNDYESMYKGIITLRQWLWYQKIKITKATLPNDADPGHSDIFCSNGLMFRVSVYGDIKYNDLPIHTQSDLKKVLGIKPKMKPSREWTCSL